MTGIGCSDVFIIFHYCIFIVERFTSSSSFAGGQDDVSMEDCSVDICL